MKTFMIVLMLLGLPLNCLAGSVPTLVDFWADNTHTSQPMDMGMHSSDNLYIAGGYDHQVYKYAADGTLLQSWGSMGSGEGQFNFPAGIGVDSEGFVYVSDHNNGRIQKFTLDGSFVLAWGEGGLGYGQLNGTRGMDFRADTLVVVNTYNHNVLRFTTDGVLVDQFDGGVYLDGLVDVAYDSQGYMYVLDNAASKVFKFNPDGSYSSYFGGFGSGDGQFSLPWSIMIDPSDNVYVTDWGNFRVQKLTTSGNFVASWGEFGQEPPGFIKPVAICLAASGDIFTLDAFNSAYRVYHYSYLPVSIESSSWASIKAKYR